MHKYIIRGWQICQPLFYLYKKNIYLCAEKAKNKHNYKHYETTIFIFGGSLLPLRYR